MTEVRNSHCLHPSDLIFVSLRNTSYSYQTKNWGHPTGPSYHPCMVILIYTEEFVTKKAAMQREKELKSGVGREGIWEKLGWV